MDWSRWPFCCRWGTQSGQERCSQSMKSQRGTRHLAAMLLAIPPAPHRAPASGARLSGRCPKWCGINQDVGSLRAAQGSNLPTRDVSVSVVLRRLQRSPPHGAHCFSRAAYLLPPWPAPANPDRTRCLRNCASRRRCRECVAADRRGRLPNRWRQIARDGRTPRGGGRRKCRRI